MGDGFQTFLKESGSTGQAFMNMVMENAKNSALDEKTRELAYLAVLAAVRLTSGVAFHVKSAKKAGATREEVMSAVLVGLPAVGITVTESLALAMNAYDEPVSL